jgi:hypothetical protein
MADAYFIVTLSSAEAGSGPNYDVLYSTDCVSYSPATPATVTLEYVGAQSYITVPDNTQCVKLTNINSNCTNSETSSVTITTTTTSTTTTAAPTTTTTTTIAPTTTTTTTPVDCRINTTINVTDTGWIRWTLCDGTSVDTFLSSLGTYTITQCIQYDSIRSAFPLADLASWNNVVWGTTCTTGTTTTTTAADFATFNWNFTESGGANGEMVLYINGSVVENRFNTSSGTYYVNVGDTISCEVSTNSCAQSANAYCIGIINDAACATSSTSFASSVYTVTSGNMGNVITLSMYSVCSEGCV